MTFPRSSFLAQAVDFKQCRRTIEYLGWRDLWRPHVQALAGSRSSLLMLLRAVTLEQVLDVSRVERLP